MYDADDYNELDGMLAYKNEDTPCTPAFASGLCTVENIRIHIVTNWVDALICGCGCAGGEGGDPTQAVLAPFDRPSNCDEKLCVPCLWNAKYKRPDKKQA